MSTSHLVLRTHATPSRVLLGALTFVAASSIACRIDSVVSLSAAERNRRVAAHVGDQITITLQTVGPGVYASPPTISSPAVTFRDVDSCGTSVPAGPTQCFHFRAASPGQALLTFTHSGNNGIVQDTVDVR